MSQEFQRSRMWYQEQRRRITSWPSISPPGCLPFLASEGKAIYKPNAQLNPEGVALSVRQNLESVYGDIDPIYRDDGTWLYLYHHEGELFNTSYTNAALQRNMYLRRPVAVLRQVTGKPHSKYRVEGLALVVGYADRYFYLEGFNAGGLGRENFESALVDAVSVSESNSGAAVIAPEQNYEYDSRMRTIRSIVQRQGQTAFRRGLLEQYRSECAVTGSSITQILDAAHILPYRGAHTNNLSNGLLLRTDIHTLFDLGLLAVDPDTRTVNIFGALRGSEYLAYDGKIIAEPVDSRLRPPRECLIQHLDWCMSSRLSLLG